MKLKVSCELDVSPTLAETIRRKGFTLFLDEDDPEVKVPGVAEPIPKENAKVTFTDDCNSSVLISREAVAAYLKEHGHVPLIINLEYEHSGKAVRLVEFTDNKAVIEAANTDEPYHEDDLDRYSWVAPSELKW